MDLVAVLQRIEKRSAEPDGQTIPLMIDPQEFGVALIDPHDQDFIPAVQAAITARSPRARTCVAVFPQGGQGDKVRLLLGALLKAVGRPAPTREQPTDDVLLQVLLILEQATDFLIVDNAEYLNSACLHFLRRDRGMAPAILVGRHRRFLQTLARDPSLNRRALVVDSPLPGR